MYNELLWSGQLTVYKHTATAAPTFPPPRWELSTQIVSLLSLHPSATFKASSFLSTMMRPGKALSPPHSCVPVGDAGA